ncbi:hypothetical protein WJX73_002046 [Symbiochloris irregularis]|uniref:Uncharacterized protein n=1 Tax=Symbiochloris irregularis TaxID=706552 RepID=A0AAW1PII8_9CHLO
MPPSEVGGKRKSELVDLTQDSEDAKPVTVPIGICSHRGPIPAQGPLQAATVKSKSGLKGVYWDKSTSTYCSRLRVMIVGQSAPQTRHRLHVTVINKGSPQAVAAAHDSAWLFVTGGRVKPDRLAEPTVSRVDWALPGRHHPRVRLLREYVLDYDPAYKLFLVRNGWENDFSAEAACYTARLRELPNAPLPAFYGNHR